MSSDQSSVSSTVTDAPSSVSGGSNATTTAEETAQPPPPPPLPPSSASSSSSSANETDVTSVGDGSKNRVSGQKRVYSESAGEDTVDPSSAIDDGSSTSRLKRLKKTNAIASSNSLIRSGSGSSSSSTSTTVTSSDRWSNREKVYSLCTDCFLHPTYMNELESEHLFELLESNSSEMTYIEIRNAVIEVWTRDVTKHLSLDDCLSEMMNSWADYQNIRKSDRPALSKLVRRVWHFLNDWGHINVGCCVNKPRCDLSKSSSMSSSMNESMIASRSESTSNSNSNSNSSSSTPRRTGVGLSSGLSFIGSRKKVLIIGGGAAGLSCARQLHNHGFEVRVLEARSRLGGRACTESIGPDSLRKAPVDLGASLITGTLGNPCSMLCRQLDARVVDMESVDSGHDTPLFCDSSNKRVDSLVDRYTTTVWNLVMSSVSYLSWLVYERMNSISGSNTSGVVGSGSESSLSSHSSSSSSSSSATSSSIGGGTSLRQLRGEHSLEQMHRLINKDLQLSGHTCDDGSNVFEFLSEKLRFAVKNVTLEDLGLIRTSDGRAVPAMSESRRRSGVIMSDGSNSGSNSTINGISLSRSNSAMKSAIGGAPSSSSSSASSSTHNGGVSDELLALENFNLGYAIDLSFETLMDSRAFVMSPKHLDVLSWHLGNLEYGVGCNTKFVSLLHWDQDDDYGFSGPHVMLCSGYQPLIESLAQREPRKYFQSRQTLELQANDTGKLLPPLQPKNTAKKSQSYLQREGDSGGRDHDNEDDNDGYLFPIEFDKKVIQVRYHSESLALEGVVASGGVSCLPGGGDGVEVTCSDGSVMMADYCVLAVPLPVMKNQIKVEPGFPDWKQRALSGMSMGNLNKLVLYFDQVYWPPKNPVFGCVRTVSTLKDSPSIIHATKKNSHNVPVSSMMEVVDPPTLAASASAADTDSSVNLELLSVPNPSDSSSMTSPDIPGMTVDPTFLFGASIANNRGRFFLWWNLALLTGQPVLVTLISGDNANTLEHQMKSEEGQRELIDEAMVVLRAMLASEEENGESPSSVGISRIKDPIAFKITRWSEDHLSGGCYSYLSANGRGRSDMVHNLKPIGDVLFFAGEHCWFKHPDTVAGALSSGIHTAGLIVSRVFGKERASLMLDPNESLPRLKTLHKLGEDRAKEPPSANPCYSRSLRAIAKDKALKRKLKAKTGDRMMMASSMMTVGMGNGADSSGMLNKNVSKTRDALKSMLNGSVNSTNVKSNRDVQMTDVSGGIKGESSSLKYTTVDSEIIDHTQSVTKQEENEQLGGPQNGHESEDESSSSMNDIASSLFSDAHQSNADPFHSSAAGMLDKVDSMMMAAHSKSKDSTMRKNGKRSSKKHHSKHKSSHKRRKDRDDRRNRDKHRHHQSSAAVNSGSSSSSSSVTMSSSERESYKQARMEIARLVRKFLSKHLKGQSFDKEDYKECAKKATDKVCDYLKSKMGGMSQSKRKSFVMIQHIKPEKIEPLCQSYAKHIGRSSSKRSSK